MLVIVVCAFATPVFASGNVEIDTKFTQGGSAATGLNKLFSNAWSTIQLVANFIALVMVVFAGVRYMFASADAKADIKKSMTGVIVGLAFAFCAGSILSLMVGIGDSII